MRCLVTCYNLNEQLLTVLGQAGDTAQQQLLFRVFQTTSSPLRLVRQSDQRLLCFASTLSRSCPASNMRRRDLVIRLIPLIVWINRGRQGSCMSGEVLGKTVARRPLLGSKRQQPNFSVMLALPT
jgi:hypothetical protein